MAKNLDFKPDTVCIKDAITSRDCVTFEKVMYYFF